MQQVPMPRFKPYTLLVCLLPLLALTFLLTPNMTSYTHHLYGKNSTPQDSQTQPLHRPFLVRRDPHTGRDVRVMVSVVSTQMTMAACMNVASGYLSGIPIYVAGYHSSAKYNHTHKVRLVLDAARKVGLTSEDVVFFLDSDTVFTGPEQFLAAVDGFIAESAASAGDLDARAVREGRVRAPMMVGRERACWAPHTLGSARQCEQAFNRTNEAYTEYAKVKGIKQYVKRFSYLNSGTYIVRLWALEEVATSFHNYTQLHSISHGRDQSIFNALYLDLRSWEVRADALSLKARAPSLRSQYGLRAGLLEVDECMELSNVWTSWKECVISNEFWLGNQSTEVMVTESPFAWNYDVFTAKIYNQYKQPLRRYPLPPTTGRSSRSASAHTHQFFGHAVPPTAVADHGGNVLLTTVPRRIASAIIITAGVGPLYERYSPLFKNLPEKMLVDVASLRFRSIAHRIPHLSWYIPLKYNATRMATAKAYLSELHIPLISDSIDLMGSYKEMCIDTFATNTDIHPFLYQSADAYNLFFDFYQ